MHTLVEIQSCSYITI